MESQIIRCTTCTGQVLKAATEQEMRDKLFEWIQDERRYICTDCDESYMNEGDAKNCCDAEVNRQYLCPICGKEYTVLSEPAETCCIPKLRCVPRVKQIDD